MFIGSGHIYRKIYRILYIIFSIRSQAHQIGPPAFALGHIGQRLFIKLALCEHSDHQRTVLDQAYGSVL